MKKISIGFSPCPNDTFIFDALVHRKIDTEGLVFEVHMADVEALNQQAFQEHLDVTKLSYHAYLHLLDSYVMLDSGSALGNNCGPLLIKNKADQNPVEASLIAIPGVFTTANFLLNYAFPKLQNKKVYLFSEIESALKNKEACAGLIIHENRFTYAERGFEKVMDLGLYWEQHTEMPIPLGGIAVKRNIDKALQLKIQKLIRKSVEFAFRNPKESKIFITDNAQEMNLEIVQKHIDLYVNSYSHSLGEKGRSAIEHMYNFSVKNNIILPSNSSLFV